jgi:hypothetical protein
MTTKECTAPSLHRKIIGYRNYFDVNRTHMFDAEISHAAVSHGTHVAGSALGSSSHKSLSAHNGQAPDAKLIFTQHKMSPGASIIMPDLYTQYFPYAFNLGARIFSNSWVKAIHTNKLKMKFKSIFIFFFIFFFLFLFVFQGSNTPAYTTATVNVDEFVNDFPDSLGKFILI